MKFRSGKERNYRTVSMRLLPADYRGRATDDVGRRTPRAGLERHSSSLRYKVIRRD